MGGKGRLGGGNKRREEGGQRDLGGGGGEGFRWSSGRFPLGAARSLLP
jgi:hypothetical protein